MAAVRVHEVVWPPDPTKPVRVPGWPALKAGGHRIGPDSAPITIAEFSDFQCPYCREFRAALDTLRSEFPGAVAVVYRHWPITRLHAQAMPSAVAAVCAGAQGRFPAMRDTLFSRQASLGSADWVELATVSGVPDSAEFRRCLSSAEPRIQILNDSLMGVKVEVRGTPTVVMNGWKFRGTPTVDQLRPRIRRDLARLNVRSPR
jgi:protein-disulfide isomerase